MLKNRVVIYVPSKIGDVEHPEMQAQWKQTCLERFSGWFGGATAMNAEGAWMGDDGLVIENVVLVYAYCDDQGMVANAGKIRELAREIASAMSQDCVSVEIDGGLEFADAA